MVSNEDPIKLKDKIVTALLKHVTHDGWSLEALERGAKDAKIDVKKAKSLFEHNVDNMISHYSDMIDRQMLVEVQKRKLPEMKVRERIATCVITRIKLLAPHREAARRAATYLSIPTNIPLGTKLLYQTVNQIWFTAGDTSTDFNFYSKRMLLSGVYTSTMLYWFNDDSIDYVDTWRFLDRRIDNVMMIPKIKSIIGDAIGSVMRGFTGKS